MSSSNAIELLKSDHEKVKKLLTELAETTNRAEKKRVELLGKIKKEILMHTKLEEEVFYPEFKNAGGAEHRKMFFEATEEHRAVEKMVLPDLEKTDPNGDQFHGRAKVLKELIEHHVQEEEQDMFTKAQKVFSKDELQQLGQRIERRKRELEKERRAA